MTASATVVVSGPAQAIRASYALWAYGSATGIPAFAPAPPVEAILTFDGPAGRCVDLLVDAERQYRRLLLRERDMETVVLFEAFSGGVDRLSLAHGEHSARWWLLQDEEAGRGAIEHSAYRAKQRAGCAPRLYALQQLEEIRRHDLCDDWRRSLGNVWVRERPVYLTARRDEMRRLLTEESDDNVSTGEDGGGAPPTTRSSTATGGATPTPSPPAAKPSATPSPSAAARVDQGATPPHQPQGSNSGGAARRVFPDSAPLPQPRPAGGARDDAQPLAPSLPPPRKPSVGFLFEFERESRDALVAACETFHATVSSTLSTMNRSAPGFARYALESDETTERRAIAGGYFLMLLSAVKILAELTRRDLAFRQRRRQMAQLVPVENAAWLQARQRQTRHEADNEANMLAMERAHLAARHEQERVQEAQRRAAGATETQARVDLLHEEASQRAVLAAQAENSWRQQREAEIKAALDAHRRATTLVWTEKAFAIGITQERSERQQITREEAELRRSLWSGETAAFLRARRAEVLNSDVASALKVYDDHPAGVSESLIGATAVAGGSG